ncbi:hypothetical protein K4K54_011362 [Colletotrichum sp. SAR 10_86]|nr:hypothetical protein K4K54_011362 [Colletotrichum sp. SAR 10_86]
MRTFLMRACACAVAAAVYWYTQLRSPPLPVPIISTPGHQISFAPGLADTIKNICDVYWDYLSYSTATQVPTFYEALGLDDARNPGVADVWSALQDRLDGIYHANGAPLADDGPAIGSLHGAEGKEYFGSFGDGEPSLGLSPPVAPQASEAWTQIGNVLMDSKLRSTYDRAFMPVLTGLGVDRKAALSNMCLWDREQ